MIKEAYVSYEIAKLLKGKGFAELLVNNYYTTKGERVSYLIPEEQYLCPTLQMACKWLREVHNKHIYTLYAGDWLYVIQDFDDGLEYTMHVGNNNEECIEVALKYALENLI